MNTQADQRWPQASADDDAFIALVERVHSDDATVEDAAALSAELRNNPDRLALYAALSIESEHLREAHRPTKQPEAPQRPIPIYRKGYEPKPSRIHPAYYAIVGVAAALLAACGIAIYFLAFNAAPTPDPVHPNQPGPSVATLIENTGDLTTPHGYPAEGEDFSAGEYTLTSGGAEFMLTNAVNVKLRGDTRMVMRNDMNVSLTRGTAEFVVPRNATGFTAHLPNGLKVIDRGTRFVVTVEANGDATVSVLEGEVEAIQARSDGSEERLTLTLGQEIRSSASAMAKITRKSIAIADASFDEPNLPDAINGGPSVWKSSVAYIGVFDPSDEQFPGTTGDNRATRFPTGGQVGYVESRLEIGATTLEQKLESTVIPNARYTLRFLVGQRADVKFDFGFDYAVQLVTSDGHVIVDQRKPTDAAPGRFEKAELHGVAPADATGDLVIRFMAAGERTQAFFDDVQLESESRPSAVPTVPGEPTEKPTHADRTSGPGTLASLLGDLR